MDEQLRTAVADLSDDLDALTAAVTAQNAAMVAQSAEIKRRSRWSKAAALLAVAVLLGFAAVIFDNRRAIDESNRRWCPVVGLIVPRPGDPPSTTERGKLLGQRARVLYEQFGCPQPPG